MKKSYFFKIFLLGLCVTVILNYISCKQPSNSSMDLTYTVWTSFSSYADFQSNFQSTLGDGRYIRLEFTEEQWNTLLPKLTDTGKHNWTKNQIKDWFLGRGFGDVESTRESSWITTIEHGFIASRTNSIVYYILK